MPQTINLKKIVDLILFGLSYIFLYFHLWFNSEILLVPWEASPEEIKAPIGSLARNINDYFGILGRARIPALAIIAITLIILFFKLRKDKNTYKTLEESAITNILYITLNFITLYVYLLINTARPSGFDPTLIGIDVVFLLGFFFMQYRGYDLKD